MDKGELEAKLVASEAARKEAEKDAARYRAKRYRDFKDSGAQQEKNYIESYDRTCDYLIERAALTQKD